MLSAPSLIKLITVSAVSPFDPLAIVNRVPAGLGELGLTAAGHGHNAGESSLVGNRIDYLWPRQHPPSIKPRRFRSDTFSGAYGTVLSPARRQFTLTPHFQ
jgi:hypothetical protein